MVKNIKRTTDNKFLKSLENDIWVDNMIDAFDMTYRECETVKETLLLTYSLEQITEIVNFRKNKPISEEEKQELMSILVGK